MKRRKRLNRVSRKLRANRRAYDAVYAEVDARSGGRCEAPAFRLLEDAAGYASEIVGPLEDHERCRHRQAEHHHTRKPRRSYHAPEWIVELCRAHHDRCEQEYARGRLVVRACGDETFAFALVYAASKWKARG